MFKKERTEISQNRSKTEKPDKITERYPEKNAESTESGISEVARENIPEENRKMNQNRKCCILVDDAFVRSPLGIIKFVSTSW